MVRKTLATFLLEASQIHGNKYDYSLISKLINRKTLVPIICLNHDHGIFYQTPACHISKKHGCPKCAILRQTRTIEEFLKEANTVHDNKYNYSLINSVKNINKVLIICPIDDHGIFKQRITNHLSGSGCPKCANKLKGRANSLQDFINSAQKTHKDTYDYSYVLYKDRSTEVKINCKVEGHGIFVQTPNYHISGAGCPKCLNAASSAFNYQKFVSLAKQVHGDKYIYPQKEERLNNKVKIICPKHQEFFQTHNKHITEKHGCPKCAPNSKVTFEEFLERANKIHNNKYDYSDAKFTLVTVPIKINCPIKGHSPFYQTPTAHANAGHGCPKCSKIGVSKPETQWLDFLGIPKKWRQARIKIINKKRKISVDALDQKNKTIYEFYGDFWHGNPEVFDPNQINGATKNSFGELHQNTIDREIALQQAGYQVIPIWEAHFNEILQYTDQLMQNLKIKKPSSLIKKLNNISYGLQSISSI